MESGSALVAIILGVLTLLGVGLTARLLFFEERWTGFRQARNIQRVIRLFGTTILQGPTVPLSDDAKIRVNHGAYGLVTVRVVDEDVTRQIYGAIDKGFYETVAREFSDTLQIPIEW
jgi:hypothetical protein